MYTTTGRAVYPEGLKVEPKTYFSLKSTLKVPRLCIVDIALQGLSLVGGPAHLLSQALRVWYEPFSDPTRLLYLEHTLKMDDTANKDSTLAAIANMGRRASSYVTIEAASDLS